MPEIAMPALTFGCDSAIEVRCPPADQPDTTMPSAAAAERGQLPAEEIDTGMDFGDDLVERRVRRQRIADQRDIDAMRHRPFGKDREDLLGARLPVAAVDEQQRRRPVSRFQEIDPVALARAIAQIEMVGMALAHLAGTLLPTGDHLDAAGHRDAVVEAEVALPPGSSRASPAHQTASSCRNLRSATIRVFHFAGKCSTAPPATKKRKRTGDTEVADQGLVRETAMCHRRQTEIGRSHAARSARRAGEADRRGRRQGQRAADAVLRPRPRPRHRPDEEAGRRARPARRACRSRSRT